VFVVALFRNGSTDFIEVFSVYLVGMRIGLKVFFTLPYREGARTGILRFTVDIFDYKWLLLVIDKIILVKFSIVIVWLSLVNQVQSNHIFAHCPLDIMLWEYIMETELHQNGDEQSQFFLKL